MTRPHWAAVAAAALTVCGTLPTEMCACPPARTHLIVYGTVRTSEGVAVQGARVFVVATRSGATIDRSIRLHPLETALDPQIIRVDQAGVSTQTWENLATVEQLGASVKAQWSTLGRFDFVSIVEAPDDLTMARVSLELGSRGTSHYETLPAIPIDDFIAAI